MTEPTDADRTGAQPPAPDEAEMAATDEEIALLRLVLDTVDAPPPHVVAFAKEAFVWRDVDAELAELVHDSATASTPAAVRAADATRQVMFQAPGIEVELELISDHAWIVMGQLVPAQEAAVELHRGDRIERTTTDTLGRFAFDDVAGGPVKLIVVTASGTRVQTEGLVL